MKILSTRTTRGTSYRVHGDKRKLRDIVDKIYDKVELEGHADYFANIKSAGKGYIIDYFRMKAGWMDENTADQLSQTILDIADQLGYSENVTVELEDAPEFINKNYGHECCVVKVRVK